MSRKRRNRPAAQRRIPADTTKVVDKGTSLLQMARDGYINSLAYLGEASPLSQANDFERHSISWDYELLTVLYRECWLAARIIDTPCEDMTRSWYSLSSEIDQDKLDEFAKQEAKHSIQQEITNAIRWGRLYGGAAAVIVIKGQEDMLDQPLDFDMLQPGCFRGLIVVDKTRGIWPSIELEDDMDDPEFGYPKYYHVTLDEEAQTDVKIHHTRLLLFRGRQLPIQEEINADYWGASELEHVYEELQKRNSSSANIAQLIFQANVAAMKISDYGEVLGMGTEQQREQIYKTIAEVNRIRTSFGLAIMGTEDSYEQHPYSFSGVAEVYETFMMDMAGAAEIPATKLFGRAPQGMNSTGESDMKNYYEVIAQNQERVLKPALEKLIPVMAMSLWGEVPDDLEIVFEPLGTTTPSERAEIMSQSSSPIIQAYSAGLLTQKMALLELRESGKPINAWTNITDEDIEKASDEFDMGEEEQDPMAAMMGGMGGAGGEMPEGMPQGGENPPPEAQEGQEQASQQPEDETQAEEMMVPEVPPDGQTEDGGPGSGPPPGYRKKSALHHGDEPKKPGLLARAKFIANPTAGMPEVAQHKRTAASVARANKEREDWSNLSMRQKIKGNSEQENHIRNVKAEVAKLAAKGDIAGAKKIVKANRHYWSNDPASAEKIQSETLARQKAVKPRFMHDLVSRIFGR